MKLIITVILSACSGWLLFSCTKSKVTGTNVTATIHGKWNLLSDSTFQGVGVFNHPVNYTGQAGDYFDFGADGKVYTKEGPVLDTSHYDLLSDTTIIISSFGVTINGVPEISHITTLTAHNATINAPVLLLPGGEFGRIVHLGR